MLSLEKKKELLDNFFCNGVDEKFLKESNIPKEDCENLNFKKSEFYVSIINNIDNIDITFYCKIDGKKYSYNKILK